MPDFAAFTIAVLLSMTLQHVTPLCSTVVVLREIFVALDAGFPIMTALERTTARWTWHRHAQRNHRRWQSETLLSITKHTHTIKSQRGETTEATGGSGIFLKVNPKIAGNIFEPDITPSQLARARRPGAHAAHSAGNVSFTCASPHLRGNAPGAPVPKRTCICRRSLSQPNQCQTIAHGLSRDGNMYGNRPEHLKHAMQQPCPAVWARFHART